MHGRWRRTLFATLMAAVSTLVVTAACEPPPASSLPDRERASVTPNTTVATPTRTTIAPPITQSVGRPRLETGAGWLYLAWTERGLGAEGDALFVSARSQEDGRWRDLTTLSQNVAATLPLRVVSAPPRAVAVTWSGPIGGGQIRPWMATSDDGARRFSAPQTFEIPAGALAPLSVLVAPPSRLNGPWTAATPLPSPSREPSPPHVPSVSSPSPYTWATLRAPSSSTGAARLETLRTCGGGGALGLWCAADRRASLGTRAATHPLDEDSRCVSGQRPLACHGNHIGVATRSARSGKTWLSTGRTPSTLHRMARLPGVVERMVLVDWVDDAHLLAVWVDEFRVLHAMTVEVSDGRTRSLVLAAEVLEATAVLDDDRSRTYVAWTTAPATNAWQRDADGNDGRGVLQIQSVALPAGMLSADAPVLRLDPGDSTR